MELLAVVAGEDRVSPVADRLGIAVSGVVHAGTDAGDDPAVETVSRDLGERVAETDPDLVALDGAVPAVARGVDRPVVAVHGSLLPAFPGPEPVEMALSAGVPMTGASVYAVRDPEGAGAPVEATADAGRAGAAATPPVLAADPVAVRPDDDRASLGERVYRAGERALERALRGVEAGRLDPATGEATGDGNEDRESFPPWRVWTADRVRELRYGENPHQRGALYAHGGTDGLATAPQLNPEAREPSYNNYTDADAALGLARAFDRPAAVVVKHGNPAGCATADATATAYRRALSTDPMSAYGGIVGLNRECDAETAREVADSYKEVVVAPGYTDDALAALRERESLRVLAVGEADAGGDRPDSGPIDGGRLLQDPDRGAPTAADLRVVTDRAPDEDERETMLFAWRVARAVHSNAIVLATGTETVGVGAGQMSRVDAVELAVRKAREHAEGKSPGGAVLASDGFFPFADGIEAAADAGVAAVVQPGGSVNDDEVTARADDLGLAMVHTDRRCFRH
jgi:phosphoribosylaminoimidazolecarboxamide formyltransferase/IMP cyclohydrolase